MRWTRQRQAGGECPGRRPGARRTPCTKGASGLRRSVRRKPSADEPRCAVRTGVEIRPICIAFVRRPKSCGPLRNPVRPCQRLTGRRSRTAETTVTAFGCSPGRARSKPKNPLRAERRMYPVLSWCLTRALVFIAHEAADAPCVRRSARPRCEGGDFAMARTGQSRALTSPARPRRKEQGGSNTSEGRRGFVSARMVQAPRAAVKNRAVAARLFG